MASRVSAARNVLVNVAANALQVIRFGPLLDGEEIEAVRLILGSVGHATGVAVSVQVGFSSSRPPADAAGFATTHQLIEGGAFSIIVSPPDVDALAPSGQFDIPIRLPVTRDRTYVSVAITETLTAAGAVGLCSLLTR